ncbi:DUF3367 domain-containing protein [Hoyosella rhizosphaerae]|nr:DUF3367 domain-containing protein [Hoyosella rhizosphaerae]
MDCRPLPRSGLFVVFAISLLASFAQAPGLIVADTKLDLTVDPRGFLERASHLWSSLAPFGQTQNQAYGYFFPQGPLFVLTELVNIPAWMAQRLWWALLLAAGYWGVIRVAEALGIGSRTSRIVAALAFALSPRALTTLGAISSETTPMMLAPWALLPVILALNGNSRRPLWQLAAGSAFAIACMGAINAVATLFGAAVAGLWWLAHRPNRRWWIFSAWWIPFSLAATAWWVVPLLMLGAVSPPFLDYIESAGTTTRWMSLVEVLRGTDSWTPFVSPDRIAGAILVTQPVAVLATGIVAAAGLTGLAMKSMPARGRLVFILMVGLVGIGAGYAGGWGSPISEPVRAFLDAEGAPLRNIHKIEPLIRLPIVLGIAHLLAHVALPGSAPRREWLRSFARPERNPFVAVSTVVLVSLLVATSLAWTGKLAPRGAYAGIPDYWSQTADFLAEQGGEAEGLGSRALVIPAAPFGSQVWGLTRDEPLQPLARTPWGSRDVVPLIPPGGIRALDSVQRLIAAGNTSAGLAPALAAQGVRFIVLRNDLDPVTSQSVAPAIARQTVLGSPGFVKVAEFGGPVGPEPDGNTVPSAGLRPQFPAIEVFEIDATEPASGAYTVDVSRVPVVNGGPEVLVRLHERHSRGAATPYLLSADAEGAGIVPSAIIATDTPLAREADFGRVDFQRSHVLSRTDPRRTLNRVPDYFTAETMIFAESAGGSVQVSSSAGDATQLGVVQPGSGPAAAVDGDTATAWLSNSFETAVGQWLQLNFDEAVDQAILRITTSPAASGPPVRFMEVTTAHGSTSVFVPTPGEEVVAALPLGATDWVRITARSTATGERGSQFGIADVAVRAHGSDVDMQRRITVPSADAAVSSWELGQEYPGRLPCIDGPTQALCSPDLYIPPEERNQFARTIHVSEPAEATARLFVRARQGNALEELLADQLGVHATGSTSIGDSRGSAFAAADGDPRTVWYAPATSSVSERQFPQLTLNLAEPDEVRGVRLTLPQAEVPATPTLVRIDTGDSRKTVEITKQDRERGFVDVSLRPYETDTVSVTLLDWEIVRTNESFGLFNTVPPGIGDIAVTTRGGVYPTPSDTTEPRTLMISCDDGPALTIGNQTVQASVEMTDIEFRTGAIVEATLCTDEPFSLSPGAVAIDADPGSFFHIDGVSVANSDSAPAPNITVSETMQWNNTHRAIDIAPTDDDQFLVVPESFNTGWVARTETGEELTALQINGWQQAWVVPAGTSGEISLTFPLDRGYRIALFGGLALLLPLFVLMVAPTRRRVSPLPPSRPITMPLLAGGAVVSALAIIAGIPGIATGAVVFGGAWLIGRRFGPHLRSSAFPVVAGSGIVLAAAALSTGPWRSPTGYIGDSAAVQALALVTVAAVAVSALPFWRR